MGAVSLRSRIAQSVYDFLDVGKSPRPADCIFALAGNQERRTYGEKMWKFGYAAQFLQVSAPVKKGIFEARAEARELAKQMRKAPVRSMLIVSSPASLRSAALVFRRAFRKMGIQLTFVAVPEKPIFTSPAFRAGIWSEFRKYLLYRLLF